MAKQKKPDEPPAGVAPWMATWSDMMNLMFCFFVLLFAMSSIDAAKFDIFVASMNQTFSIFSGGGSTNESGGMMIGNGASQLHGLAEMFNSTGMNPEGQVLPEGINSGADQTLEEAIEAIAEAALAESEEMAERIEEALSERRLDGDVTVEYTSQYVLLAINGALLFDSGRTELKAEALQIIDALSLIIARFATGNIQIEGHTDNVPMGGSGKYQNNDELSSGRALAVFRFLLENTTLDPVRIIHAGRGEYIPVADNSTAEGRAMNRRVEIKLFNSFNSN